MEAKLAKHKHTPSVCGNHFNRVDQASRKRIGELQDDRARIERILQSMIANARTAGRSMARYAEQLRRLRKDYVKDTDIIELLTTPGSIWMRQVWHKEAVHPELVQVARNYMTKLLRERGWRL
jgi:hypothetical protein